MTHPLAVTLCEITKDTVRDIIRLDVAEHQKGFVAPNAVSIAQAHFEPKAWFRAVYAGDDPVGFVMVFEDTEAPEYFLWRYMIAADQQGNGYGWAALEQVIERIKGLPGASELLTSYVPGEGSPGGFYHLMGFVDNGEEDEGELVTVLTF
ncbi:MAG: GNAT family N-acetyltransferase [Acidimicrobiia bacterium]|nr:GNAT family N-acetyltransferase [Acidimicrobiia bacterium]